MELTHPDAWHTFAGGTSAASNRNSYVAVLNCGEYHIDPVSSARNVEKHIGYRAHFVNSRGSVAGGLWQPLGHGLLMTIRQARRECRRHFDSVLSPFGVVIAPSPMVEA